jgi:hypothetical protein
LWRGPFNAKATIWLPPILAKDVHMKISVINANGALIWERDTRGSTMCGIASRGHVSDDTHAKIIAALRGALAQARLGCPRAGGFLFEASAFDVSAIVSDVGPTACQVDHGVPVRAANH